MALCGVLSKMVVLLGELGMKDFLFISTTSLAQGLTHILSFGDFSRSSLPGSRESEPPWWVIRAGLLGVEALIQDRV